MILRPEIVTPRGGPNYLKRIERQDSIEHLCLELVHWGFDEIMAWIYQVQAICRKNPKYTPPIISIHGNENDLTRDMIDAFTTAGALWMSRDEKKSLGKDPLTILYELLDSRVPPKVQTHIKVYPPNLYERPVRYLDPDDYCDDLDRYVDSNYNPDHYRRGADTDYDDTLDLSELVGECNRALPDNEFEELLQNTIREIQGDNYW